MARAAGVAQSTVSRCFQPGSGISGNTRARVQEAALALGYTPNAVARSLILRQSNMVGLIVTEFTLRHNPEIVYAIGAALEARGKRLLLMPVRNDAAVHAALQGAGEYPLDGLISSAAIPEAELAPFQQRGIPVLFFNRVAGTVPVDCVATDNFAAGRDMAELLYAAGHRRFVCASGPAASSISRERARGFAAGLVALGVPDLTMLASGFTYEDGRAAFLDHIGAVGPEGRPGAVFCTNDQLAFGVLDACRHDLGWRVPQDLSVAGFDDMAEAARPAYDLTTVQQRIDQLAASAVELLERRRADWDAPPRQVLLPGRLVLRRSAPAFRQAAPGRGDASRGQERDSGELDKAAAVGEQLAVTGSEAVELLQAAEE